MGAKVVGAGLVGTEVDERRSGGRKGGGSRVGGRIGGGRQRTLYLLLLPGLVIECVFMAFPTVVGSRLMATANWLSMLTQSGCPSKPNTRFVRRTRSIQV